LTILADLSRRSQRTAWSFFYFADFHSSVSRHAIVLSPRRRGHLYDDLKTIHGLDRGPPSDLSETQFISFLSVAILPFPLLLRRPTPSFCDHLISESRSSLWRGLAAVHPAAQLSPAPSPPLFLYATPDHPYVSDPAVFSYVVVLVRCLILFCCV